MTKKIKILPFLISSLVLLYGCNKEAHWKTSILEISDITAYGASIAFEYDFGDKPKRIIAGLDFGTDPEFKTNYERVVQEQNLNNIFRTTPSNLLSNQTYYARTFMAGRKDTVWSEIVSFKTLAQPELECELSSGEIHYSEPDITETVGELVKITSSANPDLFTYKVEGAVGDLTLTFAEEPTPGKYITDDVIYNTYGHSVPTVLINCHYSYDGANCLYESERSQYIYLTKDADGNRSISFCDLTIFNTEEGECAETLKISGKFVN